MKKPLYLLRLRFANQKLVTPFAFIKYAHSCCKTIIGELKTVLRTIAGNVLKEIVEPAGAVIRASDFQLGDPTLSILELWGAEYQETNAILLEREDMEVLRRIGARERCPVSFVGTITGDGRVSVHSFNSSSCS